MAEPQGWTRVEEPRGWTPVKEAPKPVDPNEPDTYWGGFLKSAAQTASDTAKGIGEGVVGALNPVNLVRGPIELGKDLLYNKGQNTLGTLKTIASGDPQAGGNAIGNLLVAGALPRVTGMLRTKVMGGPEAPTPAPTVTPEGPPRPVTAGPIAIDPATPPGKATTRAIRDAYRAQNPTPTVGNLALQPEPEPQPFAPGIKVLSVKDTPTSWTPEAARARLEMNDWHSGGEPGSPYTQGTSFLHRADAELLQRMKDQIANPNGFISQGLLHELGMKRGLPMFLGSVLGPKLGLSSQSGAIAGAMAPEIAGGAINAAGSPVGQAALRAALLSQLSQQAQKP